MDREIDERAANAEQPPVEIAEFGLRVPRIETGLGDQALGIDAPAFAETGGVAEPQRVRIGGDLERQLDHMAGEQFVRDDARHGEAWAVGETREIWDIAASGGRRGERAIAEMSGRKIGGCGRGCGDVAAPGGDCADERRDGGAEARQPLVHVGERRRAVGILIARVVPQRGETRAGIGTAHPELGEQVVRPCGAVAAFEFQSTRCDRRIDAVADFAAQQQRWRERSRRHDREIGAQARARGDEIELLRHGQAARVDPVEQGERRWRICELGLDRVQRGAERGTLRPAPPRQQCQRRRAGQHGAARGHRARSASTTALLCCVTSAD